jgi:hypothetical protein
MKVSDVTEKLEMPSLQDRKVSTTTLEQSPQIPLKIGRQRAEQRF